MATASRNGGMATLSPKPGVEFVEFVTRHLLEAIQIADNHGLLVLGGNARKNLAQWEDDLPRRRVLMQEAREIFARVPDPKAALDLTWDILNIKP